MCVFDIDNGLAVASGNYCMYFMSAGHLLCPLLPVVVAFSLSCIMYSMDLRHFWNLFSGGFVLMTCEMCEQLEGNNLSLCGREVFR